MLQQLGDAINDPGSFYLSVLLGVGLLPGNPVKHKASKDRLHFSLRPSQKQRNFQRPLTHFSSHLIGQNCVISTFLNQSLARGFGLFLDQPEPPSSPETYFQVLDKGRSKKNKGHLRIKEGGKEMDTRWKKLTSTKGTNTCHMPSMYGHRPAMYFGLTRVDLDNEELLQGPG